MRFSFFQDRSVPAGPTLLAVLYFVFHPLFLAAQPAPPTDLMVRNFDSHVELAWTPSFDPSVNNYRVYRVAAGSDDTTQIRVLQNTATARYIDFLGPDDDTAYTYFLTASNAQGEGAYSEPVTGGTTSFSDEQLLDMVQEYTLRYFYEFGHPASGMARERNTTGTVTTGGSGFGIMALLAGIERGFITEQEGFERVAKITDFLANKAVTFHGAFPHWLNGNTGAVIPFSALDNGGDIVETAFLMQGLLAARQYFDLDTPEQAALRQRITQLWEAVEWDWYVQPGEDVITWHWSPQFGFQIDLPVRGFNETHLVYLLAIASPTHPVDASLYESGWVGNNYVNGNSYYGIELPVGNGLGGPLFFSHYSYLGFDPRGKADAYTNYFCRNKAHTLINRSYVVANPQNYVGYNGDTWGLTASDDPLVGYKAHEPGGQGDNGTITPTAALGSIVYTPKESIAALKSFYRDYGARLWGPYGFYDAFNPTEDWYASSYLAIDQGPIIVMIENYRSQLLWNNFMANPEIQPMLDAIGFGPSADDCTIVSTTEAEEILHLRASPNPASELLTVTLPDGVSGGSWTLRNAYGQRLSTFDGQTTSLTLPVADLTPGAYYLVFQNDTQRSVVPFFRQ